MTVGRPAFFSGKLLKTGDFSASQNYHLGKRESLRGAKQRFDQIVRDPAFTRPNPFEGRLLNPQPLPPAPATRLNSFDIRVRMTALHLR